MLAALLAGSALISLTLVRRADRLGRRRVYAALLAGMAVSGAVFSLTDAFALLLVAALSGTVSVEVVEAGPFTSLEQAMIPQAAADRGDAARVFGRYNAIAALVGAAGALAAGAPAALERAAGAAPAIQRWLLLYPLAAGAALLVVRGLTGAVEAEKLPAPTRPRDRAEAAAVATVPAAPPPADPADRRSRAPILRLAGLFALDSFAGGFVVQSFIVYWFTEELGASTELMAATLAATGLIQAGSFMLAPRIARRFGLLNTMVFTHLPSNLLLAAIPLAPNLPAALTLLLLRHPLSQMDVPTRQAYLALLTAPGERAWAASVTNAARVAVRPFAPPVAGAVVGSGVAGLPFFLAGGLKAVYDLALYAAFRRLPVEGRGVRPPRPA